MELYYVTEMQWFDITYLTIVCIPSWMCIIISKLYNNILIVSPNISRVTLH